MPDDITTAPREVVARLSEQLEIGISELGEYGDRGRWLVHRKDAARPVGAKIAEAKAARARPRLALSGSETG